MVKNIQMKYKNEQSQWEELYPITLGNLVELDDGQDIESALATKVDTSTYTTGIGLKADKTSIFTRTEITNLLNDKVDFDEIYSKAQIDGFIAPKANKADVYTKTETTTQITNAVAPKANTADVYTKTQTNTQITNAIGNIDSFEIPVSSTQPTGDVKFWFEIV